MAAATDLSPKNILDLREGWAQHVTGGAEGLDPLHPEFTQRRVKLVTSCEDYDPVSNEAPVEGSLRKLIQEQKGPAWIKFGRDCTITLKTKLSLKSDTTIDGTGRNVRVRTINFQGGKEFPPPSEAFRKQPNKYYVTAMDLRNIKNVIIVNLNFDDANPHWDRDWTRASDGTMWSHEGSDAINIAASSRIWIFHNRFARWIDGAIDMDGLDDAYKLKSSGITITWNRFEEVFQAMNLAGDLISLGHNYCKTVRARCPRVRESGRAHSYNNLIRHWNKTSVQSVRNGAYLWSQQNYFAPEELDANQDNAIDTAYANHGAKDGYDLANGKLNPNAAAEGTIEMEQPVTLGKAPVVFNSVSETIMSSAVLSEFKENSRRLADPRIYSREEITQRAGNTLR